MRFRSYRTKLQTAFVATGGSALAAALWFAYSSATEAVEVATRERLAAVHQTRSRQIERYFREVSRELISMTQDEAVIEGIGAFTAAWNQLPEAPAGGDRERALSAFYGKWFATRQGEQAPENWIPPDSRARTLQYFYLAGNPHELSFRQRMDSAPEAGAYDKAHVRVHPVLRRLRDTFRFYDVFLLGNDGRVLYTVAKEIDLGVSLNGGRFVLSPLAKAWRRAMETDSREAPVMEDYAAYAPSHFAPAAFLASPIWRGTQRAGVLAVQISIEEVNRVMAGERNWQKEGLGLTGQAYIAGYDGVLRSDPRTEIEKPEEYLKELAARGADSKVVEQIRQNHTAVLNARVGEETLAQLASGVEGSAKGKGLRDQTILRSWAQIDVLGMKWATIAEIDEDEALKPVHDLRNRVLLFAALAGLLFFLAGKWLGGSVTAPVTALRDAVARLGRQDFTARVPVASHDEIGDLAIAFNRVAEDLEQTTVSKRELDGILDSLLNAVFVVELPGDDTGAVMSASIRLANPAAARLLGYAAGELNGIKLSSLLPAQREAWSSIVDEMRKSQRVPAREAELIRKDGTPIPVLFAVASLPRKPGGRKEAVCAAEDITRLVSARAALKDLSGRLISAQEDERARIARELHDDLTQRVAATAIETGRLESLAGPEAREGLAKVKSLLGEISGDVHALARRLHPSTLVDLGLADALEAECRSSFERGGPPVNFQADAGLPPVSPEAALALYRITQEALNNITRHAGAQQAAVRLRADGAWIELTVSDDGAGFAPGGPGFHSGIGLASIEERIRLLGGKWSVDSALGRGTVLQCRVPGEKRA